MIRTPLAVMAGIRDCSARIDALYGDPADKGAPWKGRKPETPFTYDTAVSLQLIQRERQVLRAELPRFAVVQGGRT